MVRCNEASRYCHLLGESLHTLINSGLFVLSTSTVIKLKEDITYIFL